MLNQTFNPRALLRIVSEDDIRKHKLGTDNKTVMNSITSISYEVSQHDFNFKKIGKKVLNSKTVYSTNDTNEYFAIKKLNHVLKKIYQVKQNSRNETLKQFIDIINDGSEYQIIRADIKDFFGEVKRKDIIRKIKKDSFLGSLMIKKLNNLDSFLSKDNCQGLPRGLSISSTLSELYLRNFDQILRTDPNVYFYSRYVDDIIVVCIDNVEKVEGLLKSSLSKIGLSVNDKYQVVGKIHEHAEFDYLGVRFLFGDKGVIRQLSSNKVKTIKSRIINAIIDFKKNNDSQLLLDRIRFLTGNYKLYTNTESNNLRAGIYYNNQFINEYTQLSDLNIFLRKSLTAKKGSLSKIVKTIPKRVIDECIKLSFFEGYINKNLISFSNNRMSKIVRCWKYGK